MRNSKVGIRDPLISEAKYVHVDYSWTPSSGAGSPAFPLDGLCRAQQLLGRSFPLDLEDLVQKTRLIRHTPRLRLDDAALTHDPHAFLTQPSPRCAQVADAPTQVRAKSEVRDRQAV